MSKANIHYSIKVIKNTFMFLPGWRIKTVKGVDYRIIESVNTDKVDDIVNELKLKGAIVTVSEV